MFTDEKVKMGRFANPLWIKVLAWISASVIVVLNLKYLFDRFAPQSWQDALASKQSLTAMYCKILVALDTTASDQELLPHIAKMAVLMKSELLLLHVADAGGAGTSTS